MGAIVSAGYGFICGAYMPISQFSEGLQGRAWGLIGFLSQIVYEAPHERKNPVE